MSKKRRGAYYTPQFLADFMMCHIAPHFASKTSISFLEPSVGDGSFIKSFNKTKFPDSISSYFVHSIEKIASELNKVKVVSELNKKKQAEYNFGKQDFLHFQKSADRLYSCVAGNPPYIKKSLLKKSQIEECRTIHNNAGLGKVPVKNIWPSFLIRCTQLLEDDGILAFVLPAELLQVNFSNELRTYLIQQFQRVEIFTFDDLLFECKGQDTILLIAYKQHNSQGQFYTHITDTSQLEKRQFILTKNPGLEITETKWSHHLLSSDELTFIHSLGTKLKSIDYYCDSKPGIVTGANDFFIIDKEMESFYDLADFVRPIIQKGFFINGSVVFDMEEFNFIINAGKPGKILCLSDEDANNLPFNVKDYLQLGEFANLSAGYKCSKRKNWFVVPNISVPPDGFFFRRIHHYPKLLKNSANVLVTDSAYKIEMRNGFQIESLIYSFYNSLSLAFTELHGRYFGGGVLELTPAEFKKIPIPFTNISAEGFNTFRNRFEAKSQIEDVLAINDSLILNGELKLSREDIEKIQTIRTKLISKRFRN